MQLNGPVLKLYYHLEVVKQKISKLQTLFALCFLQTNKTQIEI